jgi:hypothetical protein
MSGERTMACLLGLLVFGSAANTLRAASSQNPYGGIVQRNVFDVKPPAPIPLVEAPPTPQMPDIWLNGLTDILGKKQVMMKVRFPSKPPKEESYILTEGQREGDIEILAIDVKAGTVKVKIFDQIRELSLEVNGVKPANAPPDAAIAQPARSTDAPSPLPPAPIRKISLTPG